MYGPRLSTKKLNVCTSEVSQAWSRTYFDLVLAIVEDGGRYRSSSPRNYPDIRCDSAHGTRVTAAGTEGGRGVVTSGADEVSGQIGAQLRGLGIHRRSARRWPSSQLRLQYAGDGMHAVAQGEAATAEGAARQLHPRRPRNWRCRT